MPRTKKITKLQGEDVSLKIKAIKLEGKLDNYDNYERRDTSVFSGTSLPVEATSEDCKNIVVSVLQSKLKLIVSPQDISTAHRLNTKKAASTKDIIVKFCRRDTKENIMKSCRTVKPTNLYVNEFLTPIRQTIAYVLRRAKKECPEVISGSTTFEGKNIVWIKPARPNTPGAKNFKMVINTKERLDELCTKTLNKPLDFFIKKWDH